MEAGKDYFVDKAPFTTLEQLERIRKAIDKTRRKYMVYYSERLHSEAGVYAGKLVKDGVIGDVVQVMGMGPHRLNPETRPDWFFHKETYGGILCDIGSHQIEQFLYYSGCENARVVNSQVGNYCHSQYPEMEDFGEVSLVGENGASNYFRVDWLTPDGLSTWGDGEPSSLGQKATLSFGNMWMWHGTRPKITCTGWTKRGNTGKMYREKSVIRSFRNCSMIASIAQRRP